MWKPVCNFPNYEVSSNGEVRSTNYNHTGAIMGLFWLKRVGDFIGLFIG